MSSKTGTGSVKGNKDSQSKRLGVKRYAGELVNPGNIIIRQKGSKFYPGAGVKKGNDYTLFAITTGKVAFKKNYGKRVVYVEPADK